MTALSAGILIFLVFMLSIAALINYLRDRRDWLRDISDWKNTSDSNEKNNAVGSGDLQETARAGVDAVTCRRGDKSTIGASARVYAKPATVKAAAPKLATAKPALKPVSTRPVYTKKYRAVSVRPQLNCCRAVLVFEHIRFLAEEAPHFPVPGCSAESCHCQYIYHTDRRDEDRRSSFGFARGWTPASGGERRRADRRRARV